MQKDVFTFYSLSNSDLKPRSVGRGDARFLLETVKCCWAGDRLGNLGAAGGGVWVIETLEVERAPLSPRNNLEHAGSPKSFSLFPVFSPTTTQAQRTCCGKGHSVSRYDFANCRTPGTRELFVCVHLNAFAFSLWPLWTVRSHDRFL